MRSRNSLLAAAACVLVGLNVPALARAEVLARSQWILPLAGAAPSKHLQVPVRSVDPGRQVWVAYKLLAASDADRPRGDLVLDAAFEGIPVPLTASKVLFATDKLVRTAPSESFRERLAAQAGSKSPEEISRAMGPDLYAVYKALSEKRGSILEGTSVVHYGVTGKDEMRLLASIDRASGMQPMLIDVAIGQGEIPAEFAPRASGLPASVKFGIFAGGLVLLAVIWLVMRRRSD